MESSRRSSLMEGRKSITDLPPGTLAGLRRSISSVYMGANLAVLIADNHASKLACKMAKAMMKYDADTLHVIHGISSTDDKRAAEALMDRSCRSIDPQGKLIIVKQIIEARTGTIQEAIREYLMDINVQLVVLGSHKLCNDTPPITNGFGSFTLRFVKQFGFAPVLIVKANSKGGYLTHDSEALGLKVMLELQPNSRYMLNYLMERLNPQKDGLFLGVSRGLDPMGRKTEITQRMLTYFNVQASVNHFYCAQRVFKHEASQALPKAVEDDGIDILALQAPRCNLMPERIIQLLLTCRSSVLVFHNTVTEEDMWSIMPSLENLPEVEDTAGTAGVSTAGSS